jgi:hypothetical protein
MVNVKAAQNQHKRPSGSGLEIRLLGPMTLQIAGKAVALPSKRVRALLAYLVQREGVAIARTTLTGLLRGERDEGQARQPAPVPVGAARGPWRNIGRA